MANKKDNMKYAVYDTTTTDDMILEGVYTSDKEAIDEAYEIMYELEENPDEDTVLIVFKLVPHRIIKRSTKITVEKV